MSDQITNPLQEKRTSGCLKVGIIGFFSLLVLWFMARQCEPTTSASVSESDSTIVVRDAPAKVDSAKIKELAPLFREKKDEFESNSWVQPKVMPPYRNQNGMYLYFAKSGSNVSNLRFVIQYYGDDWLFVNSVKFNIDGQNFDYYPDSWDKDNDADVWEWTDQRVESEDLPLLRAIANGKSVKYRLVGSQYVSDKTLSQKYINSIKNTLAYYEAQGGTF